ncbi:DedA family protein [Peribacillus saganii]|uniref:DedA family protein n=1 Tax=Peribacillus saganii TaxID=2303992 RepID=A0A372LRT4_9BACI|nr:DedA family protein [Peribacillus saganii]RFU70145.1 DedA family protein [Peribacillus saganii]
MEWESILHILGEYGYPGLFFYLWVGIFIFPLPNEVIVMSVAIAAEQGVLDPVFAFATAYAGILFAITSMYFLGRYTGKYLMGYFNRRDKFKRLIFQSNILINKYHAFSLSISYFIPGIRLFLPFIYGFSRLSLSSFALFSYTGALLWLSLTFYLGYQFGDEFDRVLFYEKEVLFVLLAIAAIYIFFQLHKIARSRGKETGKETSRNTLKQKERA